MTGSSGGRGDTGRESRRERESQILAADSVGKSYWGQTVLKAASLWVDRGTVTALLGLNGAGKTTLLEIAAGVLRPDYGTVVFRGRRHAHAWLPRLARQGLFYLPDRGLLAGSRTLRWFLSSAARRYGTETDRAWREVARDLGIGAVLDTGVDELSGGERRRAALVLAELRQPACLLADEPFRGIAPSDAEIVAQVLAGLRDRGCGIVVTGHEVPEILALADRVIWLTAGTTHGLGTPEEARDHPQFVREYLGYARQGRREPG